MRIALCLFLLVANPQLRGQSSPEERARWNAPIKPFRIIGNIYYVGVTGISSFLITTGDGDILIDGGFPETAPLIEKSISSLGFHLRDVKYLLNSHAHYDHCGGLVELKRRSGATVVSSKQDAPVLLAGRQTSFGPSKDVFFPAVKVDRVIGDKETVQVGGITLTAHLTPGHTKGCTTWTMPVTQAGKTYQVVFYCSTTVAGNSLVDNPKYPQIVSDYERSFAELRQLPCDVFLAPHPGFFHRDDKLAEVAKGRLDAFVDPTELRRYVDQSERAFHEELEQQRSARPRTR